MENNSGNHINQVQKALSIGKQNTTFNYFMLCKKQTPLQQNHTSKNTLFTTM